MASVAFEHVDKVYPDGTRAVLDCNLQIAHGELMVVVGPSGCGKSTLLRLIAGLEAITAGTLRIGSTVVNDLRPQDRNVAMVFQDYALYPYLSARGNLEFPLKMRKLPRETMRQLVERIAGLLDITQVLDRLPKHLSGGQRQRVAMGRALVREPTVFLLDEPLSNLDARLRVQVRAEIRELQQRTGTTMVYVTHDQVEAMTLGDRVAVVNEGRVQQVAAPRVLYDQPVNVFVAGFIGNPAMNLFPTRVRTEGNRTLLAVADQTISVSYERLAAALARAGADERFTAGIRPEAFELAPDEASEPGLHATVEHVEWLGHETLVHARVGAASGDDATRLVVRLQGMRDLAKGDAIRLRVDSTRVHLFDSEGRSL